jgi:NHL repeat
MSLPAAVAVDVAGDVFAIDGFGGLYELSVGGVAEMLPFSGGETAVAADAAGDVFIADSYYNRVVELPAGSGSQQTLPFTGLNQPSGVAVDAAGDVFVADRVNNRVFALDTGNNRVVELPAGGESQQTLPFSGLTVLSAVASDAAGDVFLTGSTVSGGGSPWDVVELPKGGAQQALPYQSAGLNGVAVDAAGNVILADGGTDQVVELSPTVPSGALAVSPDSGPAGTGIGVSSVTPCPLGGAFGSASATLRLYSPTGALVQTASASLDQAGDWSGTLTIPSTARTGTTYLVGARCNDPYGVLAQDYGHGAFAVATPIIGPSAAIGFPANGQMFSFGQVVSTRFSCSEAAGGPGIASCTDGSGSGSPGQLDTSSVGLHSYVVTAISRDGQAATVTIHYIVAAAQQAISFTSTPPARPVVGGSYALTATGGGSGNPVTFSIDSASGARACSLTGARVSFTGGGRCMIDANQAASSNYLAAPQAQQSLSVTVPVTVTGRPPGAGALLLRYVHSSAKYRALGAHKKAAINARVHTVSAILTRLTPHLRKAQRAKLIKTYKAGIAALKASGWLTATQAANLTVAATQLR